MTVTLNWNMENHHVIHHALMTQQLASRSPQLRCQILSWKLGNGGNGTVHPPSRKSSHPNGVLRSCTGEDAASSHAHSERLIWMEVLTSPPWPSLVRMVVRRRQKLGQVPLMTADMPIREATHRVSVPRAGLSSGHRCHSAIFSLRRLRCR